jgi:hypothetical protein
VATNTGGKQQDFKGRGGRDNQRKPYNNNNRGHWKRDWHYDNRDRDRRNDNRGSGNRNEQSHSGRKENHRWIPEAA